MIWDSDGDAVNVRRYVAKVVRKARLDPNAAIDELVSMLEVAVVQGARRALTSDAEPEQVAPTSTGLRLIRGALDAGSKRHHPPLRPRDPGPWAADEQPPAEH